VAIPFLDDAVPSGDRLPALPPTNVASVAPPSPGRFAGQSVVEELLRQHSGHRPPSRFAGLFGASPLDSNGLNWLRAAQAEIVVGDILARLPAGYRVYHSLPLRHTAFWVDHLVLGPGGIFVLSAKTHWDRDLAGSLRTIMIGDQPVPYLRDAAFEAAQMADRLAAAMPTDTVVHPVIVLVDPHKILLTRQSASVTVIDSARLRRWLVARPAVWTTQQQAAVSAFIDDPATWQTRGEALAPEHLHARFTELEQDVAAARVRRTTFTVLAAGVVVIVGTVSTMPFVAAAVEFFGGR